MRSLGERQSYEPEVGLARAVHHDYHEWENIGAAQLAQVYAVERTTDRGDILPAGPESSWEIAPGKWKWGSHHFPRPRIVEELERQFGTASPRRLAALRKVAEACTRLAEYSEHGETLAQTVEWTCTGAGVDVAFIRRQGWRHSGPMYRAALGLYGSETQFWRALTDAWGVIAVLAVEPEVLAAAEAVGAVDARALAWARARGLVSA